jgi:hypothetical protein
MEIEKTPAIGADPERSPHFVKEDSSVATAWEEIEPGRFMPRRVRGSYRGRALG